MMLNAKNDQPLEQFTLRHPQTYWSIGGDAILDPISQQNTATNHRLTINCDF